MVISLFCLHGLRVVLLWLKGFDHSMVSVTFCWNPFWCALGTVSYVSVIGQRCLVSNKHSMWKVQQRFVLPEQEMKRRLVEGMWAL